MTITKRLSALLLSFIIFAPITSFAQTTKYSFYGYVGEKLVFHKSYENEGLNQPTKFLYLGETYDDSIRIDFSWRVNPVDSLNPTMVSSMTASLFKNGKVSTIGDPNNSYIVVTDGEGVAIQKTYPSKGNETFTAKFPDTELLPNAYIVVKVEEE